jgi:hypothetical protein
MVVEQRRDPPRSLRLHLSAEQTLLTAIDVDVAKSLATIGPLHRLAFGALELLPFETLRPLRLLDALALDPLRPFGLLDALTFEALRPFGLLDALTFDALRTLSLLDALAFNPLRALGALDALAFHPLRTLSLLDTLTLYTLRTLSPLKTLALDVLRALRPLRVLALYTLGALDTLSAVGLSRLLRTLDGGLAIVVSVLRRGGSGQGKCGAACDPDHPVHGSTSCDTHYNQRDNMVLGS